jgi:hypothetical protein
VIHLAIAHHLSHQFHRLVGHAETQRREARGKSCHAQHAHRIFHEGRRHMTQHARLDIAHAIERIGERAVLVLGNRVDGEVAPRQILLQRHRRIGLEHEAVIAAPTLALGTRQRVFLTRARVKEHRKVLAHRLVAQRQQLLRIGPDHHMIAIDHRPPKQPVTHRSANEMNLHAGILPRGVAWHHGRGGWVRVLASVPTAGKRACARRISRRRHAPWSSPGRLFPHLG